MKIFVVILLCFIALSCRVKGNNQKLTKKERAVALLKSFETGDETPWREYVCNNEYIQHNFNFADGVEPLLEFIKYTKSANSKVNIIFAIEDGDTVAVLTNSDVFGQMYTIDLFRFEDYQIVEHWDNVENVRSFSLINFNYTVKDFKQTEENRTLGINYVQNVLIEEFVKDSVYLDINCINLSSKKNRSLSKKYLKIRKVVAQGNTVVIASEGLVGTTQYAFYDVLRFSDSKIISTLNIAEEIVDRKYWKNSNYKF